MVEFYVLGTLELRRGEDEEDTFLAGPKRVGLLVYLALARPRGFQRRDKLLPLFWPERGQKAARNALSNMLYHIRRVLGREVIVNRGAEEVGVDSEVLQVDATAFEEALDRDEVHQALGLYRGDLLDGFHVVDAAPAFDHWLEQERRRLRSRAAEGAWVLAGEAEQAGDHTAARAWAKQAAERMPFSEEAQMRLIRLLDHLGDRAEALSAYEAFAARLRREWEIDPSADFKILAGKIRARVRPTLEKSRANREPISEDSIAVLPFEPLGVHPSRGFSEGVHGDLLTRLSNVSGLKVISRTSVRRYRNTEKSVAEIGTELNAAWVLEGEVQEVADQVQVNARLVDSRADRQVWAGDYLRKLTAENLFQIQGEITREIVRSLEMELTPEEVERVEQRPTKNLEAYRLYAQGRGSLEQRTEDGIRQGLRCFQEALSRDEDYALAWAGLTDALSLLQFYGLARPADAPKPMDAARRAVELGPELGEAHAALGILHSIRHEGPAALDALRRAVTLTPSYAEAHIWLGWVHLCLGHARKALESARRAVQLDPLTPAFHVYLAEAWLANGDGRRALHEAKRAKEIQPAYGLAHYMEALVLYHEGQFAETTAALNRALSLVAARGTPTHAEVRALLATTCVATGDQAGARALAAQIDAATDPFSAGLVHAALGDIDAAFDAFEQVHDWGSHATEQLRYFFPDVLGPVRQDRRYQRLLRILDRSWKSAFSPLQPSI